MDFVRTARSRAASQTAVFSSAISCHAERCRRRVVRARGFSGPAYHASRRLCRRASVGHIFAAAECPSLHPFLRAAWGSHDGYRFVALHHHRGHRLKTRSHRKNGRQWSAASSSNQQPLLCGYAGWQCNCHGYRASRYGEWRSDSFVGAAAAEARSASALCQRFAGPWSARLFGQQRCG